MRIITRSEWGAAKPTRRHAIERTPRLWLHHTAGPTGQSLPIIQRYHQGTKGWTDIAYSFLVDTQGRAYEGRGPLVAGGHTAGDNTTSHAICAIGDFSTKTPPAPMIETIAALTAHGHRQGWWSTKSITGGHRQAPKAATACPGDRLQAAIAGINTRALAILGGAPATTPGVVGGFPTRILRRGDRHPDVVVVRYGLNLLRPLTGRGQLPIHETYDDLLADVVRSFQTFARAMGQLAGHPVEDLIVIDGIWGPRTAGAAAWWGAIL